MLNIRVIKHLRSENSIKAVIKLRISYLLLLFHQNWSRRYIFYYLDTRLKLRRGWFVFLESVTWEQWIIEQVKSCNKQYKNDEFRKFHCCLKTLKAVAIGQMSLTPVELQWDVCLFYFIGLLWSQKRFYKWKAQNLCRSFNFWTQYMLDANHSAIQIEYNLFT